MVTRKPLPPSAALGSAVPQQTQDVWSLNNRTQETAWGNAADRQHQQNPPPAGFPNEPRPGIPAPFDDSEDEDNVWAKPDPAPSNTGAMGHIPAALRPGDSQGRSNAASQIIEPGPESAAVPAALRPISTGKPETNPFKRKMSLSSAGSGVPVQKTGIPPVPSVPIPDFSQMSLNEANTNPWGPAPDERKDGMDAVPGFPEQDTASDNVWASARPSRQPTPGLRSDSPALVSLPSDEGSGGWEDEPKKSTLPPPLITTTNDLEGSNAWDDLGSLDKGKGVAQPPPLPGKGGSAADDWNLIDMDTPVETRAEGSAAMTATANAPAPAPAQPATEEDVPPLPPRNSAELPPPATPPKPPRAVNKSETYQIKKINWFDATSSSNPRTSPILVQNENGPCPLVALVNALTLTTPADSPTTSLVQTLKSREQLTLGLLLDAVFDELMSERRTLPDVPLPDVTELYGFLKGLHTGMNVNPRFIPTPEVVSAFQRTSLTHLPPTERSDSIPGTFEHTREMALYSTFSIPLIHGWLPSKDDVVYDAFARQAASYEDAQNLLFREEELEEKLCNHAQGLSPEEQQIYQDVLAIKSFLTSSATQLTAFGLDVIKKAMKPGSVAILFRNDHFSTLYRHPQTLELLTLVTDAGYAGHAEVVWESLVDINGERAEFLSGDFRPVGGARHDQPRPRRSADAVPDNWMDALDDDNGEWTTVPASRGRTQTSRQSAPARAPGAEPLSPKHEQEDRDLALAMQLQEEEDERARTERDRRRRESLLSEQFIEQQHGTRPRTSSARGGSATAANHARGGSRSTTSLISNSSGSNNNNNTTTNPSRRATPAQPRPASASASSTTRPIPIPGRPTTQTVRSLLPPPTTTNPRPSAAEDDDAPPPSYEQASKQLPYLPPQGHPSHPGSRPTDGEGAGRQQQAVPRGGRSPQQQQQMQGGRAPQGMRSPGMAQGGYPGAAQGQGQGMGGYSGAGYRRGMPSGGSAGAPQKERECVVM
ncbi:protein FAM63A [Staphylotrichum tortipilum]|uniref:Protein FAM63A n=1 Tax=Staphylotrichum tortipilum TaxID=2831512 RepID=A0AAN6RQL4_9PEZI|nr:protein FAM63A [Staphylotrichum longicolle]